MAITYSGRVDPRQHVLDQIGRPPRIIGTQHITIDDDGVLDGGDAELLAYIEDYLESIAVDGAAKVHPEGEWHPIDSAPAAEYGTAMVLAIGATTRGDTYLVPPAGWPG